MSLFKILTLTAILIVSFLAAFVVARGLALEQARGGQQKIGSVSTMPDPMRSN